MPKSIEIRAIVSKRRYMTATIEANVIRQLDLLAYGVQAAMQRYPSAQPWKSKPPKSGLRAGGKRTGNYGRGWMITKPNQTTRQIVNRISYGVWVGGPNNKRPGQTRVMKDRNWASVTDVARTEGRKHQAALVQSVKGIVSG